MTKLRDLRDEATRLHQAGRLAEAAAAYEALLAAAPKDDEARHMFGVLRLQEGRSAEALALFDAALAAKTASPELLAHRALALQMLGRMDEALADYDRALALRPDFPSALNNRANILRARGALADSLAGYVAAAHGAPGFADAWYNQGVVLLELERVEEAIAALGQAGRLRPDHAATFFALSQAFQRQKRHGEALRATEKSLALAPQFAPAWRGRAGALLALRRHDEALASFEKALALDPGNAEIWNERGAALHHLKLFEKALASFDKALALNPALGAALANRGLTLIHLKFAERALADFDAALALLPDAAETWYNRGTALLRLNRYAAALDSYEKALALDPAHPYALGAAAGAVLNLCDWERCAFYALAIAQAVEEDGAVIAPFSFLNHCGDARLQRKCGEIYLADQLGAPKEPLWKGERYQHEKIRIAYLSADFHRHATAFLMAGLFERHDRSRFETIAISWGRDDGTPMRARLERAFDDFIDARGMSDEAIAALLYERRIDIAIDLKGHTEDARPGILALRPCPVQVTYLGYPASTGAAFIDYVIADRDVAPFTDAPFFSEKIVHMPHSYQVNDAARAIAAEAPDRAALGLPPGGFVFCCFNNNWKIAPVFFDAWMRLLEQVEGSVLWLLRDNDDAVENLRRQSSARGIDPDRLVFGDRIALDEHLARHVHADLFLDTLPNNAHTTASDALWAGLPVLTLRGDCFSGRVGTSLLHAVGLPELVTADMAGYEALALELARDPARLAALRARLGVANAAHPLFDTDRFRQDIEKAFLRMAERARAGLAPEPFAV